MNVYKNIQMEKNLLNFGTESEINRGWGEGGTGL